ncbi:unnamed protein product [Bemisia tabaci]|uniref:Discoidin domain-containing protein n=1 Tax=Bemisia tabaci TaxID=7038 RepID=A0A9P0AG51_BEMTA|nr:unnamed protein product [Bemisia tabaci]
MDNIFMAAGSVSYEPGSYLRAGQFLDDRFAVFSEAKLWFSVGGKYFTGDPITYTYMEDRIFEHSRNITIKLHHRIGRAVKIQLFFAARWIMISEVNFDSAPANGNFSEEVPVSNEAPAQPEVYVEKDFSHTSSNVPGE